MSLDKSLFTLTLNQDPEDPRVIDLVDPSGVTHYRKQRIPGPIYKIEVYDPMSESLLITASAPSATSKVKSLELCNPTSVVELKFTGTISFRWAFKWEEHEFEWKREECFMIRKPDPPVLVAVTKEPAGRIKTSVVQILDYNLNRFDIDDRKGLEIVILTALLTFQDSSDTVHSPKESSESSPGFVSSIGRRVSAQASGGPPPPPPPKPDPRVGVDRIAEMQAIRGEINEVAVSEEGDIEAYANYCWNLLQDDAMLFIIVRSASAATVPKVLQVVHQTKRLRHKAGLSDDDLHQYVTYDTTPKGPKRINLDDEKADKYAPPESLTVHLSKIPMPELQPKRKGEEKPTKELTKEEAKARKKQEEARKKEEKLKKKYDRKKAPSPPRPEPTQRPSSSQGYHGGSQQAHVRPHQAHPYQPSPSPSQLNNPAIYAAPPPGRHNSPSPRPGALNTNLSNSGRPSFPQANMPQRPNSFHGGGPPQQGSYPAYVTSQSGHLGVPSPPPPPPPPPVPTMGQLGTVAAQKVVTGLFDKFNTISSKLK